MFEFKADIVKRRKFSKRYFLLGVLSAGLLGYAGYTFLKIGVVPFIEMLIEQIGVGEYSTWVYAGIFALLAFLIIPALRTIFKKKRIIGGKISFDEEKLEIKKGRQHFVIPEQELSQMNFELKKLPSGDKKSKDKLFGGSYMKIPTNKGIFECELDINNKQDQDKLLEMIEFLKIEHDVKVELKEIK